MNRIIAAIEQETKYVKDLEGNRQYRKGYVQALEAVSVFLIGQSGGWSSDADNPAVQRLFAFLALHSEAMPIWGKQLDLPETMTPSEQQALEIALAVLRSPDEASDFLNWWLHNYGVKAVSPEEPSCCPIFPDRPAPTTEAELELLDAELDLLFPTGHAH